MKISISSLKSVCIKPENDLETLIMDDWYGKDVAVSSCINNAGLNFPQRYISYVITFEDKKDEKTAA